MTIVKGKKKSNNIFDNLMAFWATVNLTLVLFDLSYLPWRDFWLQGRVQLFIKIEKYQVEIPKEPLKILPFSIANYYDWVKGIEPYRDTEAYLKSVDTLNKIAINNSNKQENIEIILADLRKQSQEIIDTNPFQIANKTGTLEKIKNKMRVHIFDSKDASAKGAFAIFWSKEYLEKKGIKQELIFFEQEIKPLIETNYYREIDENGHLVDNFGMLDFSFFTIYFLGDFLTRTWYFSQKNSGIKWLDAILYRWYDIFLFLPVFRWLRIIPVIIRLNQIGLINLTAIQKKASQVFVAGIAEELTEVVVIKVINQTQNLIAEGKIGTNLVQQKKQEYIDINDQNEVVEITRLILKLIVNQVIPKIRPEVEALLTYSLEKTLSESKAYQRLSKIPGLTDWQHNLTAQIITQFSQIITDKLPGLLEEDREFDALLGKITLKFSQTISSELQAQESMAKIQKLLIEFLEEVKINYIQKLSQEDIEDILAQKRALQNQTERITPVKSLKNSK
jgi:hypothetical protein